MRDFLICPHAQGTEEWKADRAGKATGSNAKHILAKIKNGEAAARRDYRARLVAERLSGRPVDDGFVSPEMRHGTEQEPFAREAYERITGHIVRECGFVYLPGAGAGCSVDGFTRDETGYGIIEIKCPKTATHLDYLLREDVPSEHMPQIRHNLLITGADWCDFVSFDPRVPLPVQTIIRRIRAADAGLADYAVELEAFLDGVAAFHSKVKTIIQQVEGA